MSTDRGEGLMPEWCLPMAYSRELQLNEDGGISTSARDRLELTLPLAAAQDSN
jgi:hypothetical protein